MSNKENKHWVEEAIEKALAEKDDVQKLLELSDIAQHIADEFTWSMGALEDAISDALYEVSPEACKETGYYSVSDVTQDITITKSFEW